ncbi:MAG: hypothetical protein R3B06_12650 [Kofleriaceae bacterium]
MARTWRNAAPRPRRSWRAVAVRGNRTVTDQNPEATYEALDRYTPRPDPRWLQSGKLDPVIGRDDEIRRTIQILSRRSEEQSGAHEAGVGKTAVVEGIAGRTPPATCRRACGALPALDLGAGGGRQVPRRVRGAPEGGAQGSAAAEGQVISFIDELHNAGGAGRRGVQDAANMSAGAGSAASCMHRR